MGGCVDYQSNNATLWLHLASWDLPDSQLSWEFKIEPSVAKKLQNFPDSMKCVAFWAPGTVFTLKKKFISSFYLFLSPRQISVFLAPGVVQQLSNGWISKETVLQGKICLDNSLLGDLSSWRTVSWTIVSLDYHPVDDCCTAAGTRMLVNTRWLSTQRWWSISRS